MNKPADTRMIDYTITNTKANRKRGRNWSVLAEVLSSRSNQVTLVLLTITFSIIYTILLPFEFTQRLSFANWNYLDPYLGIWSVVIGAGMSLVILLQIHAMRRIGSNQTGALGGLAFIGSVLPSFLCCTPIIPTLLAFIGLSTVSIYGTTGTLQHFFATKQTEFLAGSAVLLLISAWWSIHSTATSRCLNDGSCSTGSTPLLENSQRKQDPLIITTKGVSK